MQGPDPDEIARMGATGVREQAAEPILELQFADVKTRTPLGTAITLESEIRELPPPSQIPSARECDRHRFGLIDDYYREMATYLAETSVIPSYQSH